MNEYYDNLNQFHDNNTALATHLNILCKLTREFKLKIHLDRGEYCSNSLRYQTVKLFMRKTVYIPSRIEYDEIPHIP